MRSACVCMEQFESRTLLSAGLFDSSYHPPYLNALGGTFFFQKIHMQLDGKSLHYAGLDDFQIWRQNPNGSLDKSFGSGGKITFEHELVDFAVDNLGRIIAWDFDRTLPGRIHLMRFDANGSVDKSFGSNGESEWGIDRDFYPTSMAVQNDNRIILSASSNDSAAMLRVNVDGTHDMSFGVGGVSLIEHTADQKYTYISSLAIRRSDNRIVAAGDIVSTSSTPGSARVFVFSPGGTLESTRALDPSIHDTGSYAIAVDPDGSILLGATSSDNVTMHGIVARFSSPQSAPQVADLGPTTLANILVASQPDGKVIAAAADKVWRFNHDMSPDKSFANKGSTTLAFSAGSLAVQGNGKLLVNGDTNVNTTTPSRFGQLRLTGDSPPSVVTGRTLKIFGSAGRDQIRISRSGRLISVWVNNADPALFSAKKIKRLSIDAGDGDDTIILSRSVPPAAINGGGGDDSVLRKRKKDKLISIEH
jgi:uncharacterized delta-60 repeat protein